jgi:predicted peptidase
LISHRKSKLKSLLRKKKMKKTLLFLLVTLGVAATANAQSEKAWMKVYQPHIYNDMPYRLLRPTSLKPDKSYPVIVSLHRGGCTGTDNLKQMKTGLQILSEKQNRKDYPCYIIAPQAQGKWSPEHLQNIKDIINDLPSVDMDRIYVLGHSMGGAGTYKFIQTDSKYFAAAAPSAGSGLTRQEGLIDPTLIKDVPVWAFHGDQDKVCPIEKDQKIFAKVQELGGNMKLTTWVGDGHPVEPKMFTGGDNGVTQHSSDRCDTEPVFLKWLFSKKRAADWMKLYEPNIKNDMQYRLLKPLNSKPGERYPVIVSLHSSGGRGSDNLRQLNTGLEILTKEQNRKDYPCYILAPQMQNSWDLQHLKAVKEIINDLPSVDKRRIYIMGHSKGGFGTYSFVEADPKYFAAAVPLAGSGSGSRREIDASKIKDVPIWAFHGDQDTKFPIEKDQKIFAKIQELGGKMKLTTWKGDGHGIETKMFSDDHNGTTELSSNYCDPQPDFMKWLFAHKISPEWKEVYEYHIYDDMQYRLLRPNNFDPKRKYPVVVAIHSAAGRHTDNRKQLEKWHLALTAEHQKNEDYNSYILAPQSPGRWTPKHLDKVKDIISDLPAKDMDRIYVFGHSMGGSGTYTFVQADPKYFAAAAASAGGGDDIDVSTFKDLPMWIFFGDQDKIERARTVFAKMQKIGGNMKFTTWVGDGHPVAPQMITGKDNGVTVYSSDKCDPEPVFLKWLFTQKRTKK